MKEISRLVLKHEDLKEQCSEFQNTVRENLKERIANKMCAKDSSLTITAQDIDLDYDDGNVKLQDCYKSEFTDAQMRHIDANVATWMEKKHRGSWRWI